MTADAREPSRLVAIPLTGGHDNTTDARLRDPGKLTVARNVWQPTLGTIEKRYGFSKVTSTLAGGGQQINAHGPVRGLGRTSEELLAFGHRELFALPTNTGIVAYWHDRGPLSPCNGTITERFRAQASYTVADIARSGSVLLLAAQRFEDRGGSSNYQATEVVGVSADGDVLLQSTQLDANTIGGGNNYPYAPLVAPHGEGIVLIHGYDNAAAPGTLKRYDYVATTPHVAPVALSSLTTDLYYRGGVAVYDIIGCANGDYVVAWIDNTNLNINLRRYNSAHVLQYSSTITGDWYAVALAERVDASGIYVLAAELVGAGADNIKLWERSAALVASWGPTTMGTVTNAAYGLGVAQGTDTAANDRVQCAWVHGTGGWGTDAVTRSCDMTGAGLDTGVTTYNADITARPFWYRNRCYLPIVTASETDTDAAGFESQMLLDLECNETGRDPKMAALWGVSQSLTVRAGVPALGAAAHSPVDADGKTFRLMSPMLAEVLAPKKLGDYVNESLRFAVDEVALTFDGAVTSTPLHRRSAVMSGGMLVYYDGERSFELGFARPPMPYGLTQGGGILTGTQDYSAVWMHQDASGALHRSLPSPASSQTTATSMSVDLYALTLPGTHRPRQDICCQWYRAGADTIPRRVNRIGEVIGNAQAQTTTILTDNHPDADMYIPRYTVGGVLEAVAPDGARVVATARERLLVGGFFRDDRMQYSKLVVPSAAGETTIAPELYEALSRASSDGAAMTGIAALDQTTIVLTERQVLLVAGSGPDATGAQDDMSRFVPLASDTGCIEPRSVVVYPDGVLFQSTRGIYRVDRGHSVTPIGEPVLDLLDAYPVVTSAVLVPRDRQVRFTVQSSDGTDGRILVHDYRAGVWYEWQVKDSTGATIVFEGAEWVDDIYYAIESNGMLWKEDTTTWYDNNTQWVPMTIETAEVQPDGPLHWYQYGELAITGERYDPHGVTISVYNDYDSTATATVSYTDTQLQALPNATDREQLHWLPPYPRAQSRRVRITDTEDTASSTGRGAAWHAIVVDVATMDGTARAPAQARQ